MTTLNRKILLRRGDRSELSSTTLDTGEPGFATDTNQLYIGTDEAIDELVCDPFPNANNTVQTWLNTYVWTRFQDENENVIILYADLLQPNHTYEIKTAGTTDFTLIGAPDNNVGTIFVANSFSMTLDGDGEVYEVLSPYTIDEDLVIRNLRNDPNRMVTYMVATASGFGIFDWADYIRTRNNVEVVTENSFNQMFADQHLETHAESTGLRSSLFKKTLSDDTNVFVEYSDINSTLFVDYSLKQTDEVTATYVRVGTLKVINGLPHGIEDAKLTDENTEIWQDNLTETPAQGLGVAEPDEFSNIVFSAVLRNERTIFSNDFDDVSSITDTIVVNGVTLTATTIDTIVDEINSTVPNVNARRHLSKLVLVTKDIYPGIAISTIGSDAGIFNSEVEKNMIGIDYTQDAGFSTEISYTVKRWSM